MAIALRTKLVLTLLAGLGLSQVGPSQAKSDDPGIQKLLADFEAAFNQPGPPSARAKALAALCSPDFVVGGSRDEPPEDLATAEAHWTRQFSTGLKAATLKLTVRTVHFLKSDVAFIDLDHEMANVEGDDGKPQTVRLQDLATVVKKGGRWLIADARQFPLSEAEPPKVVK
ncbi:MAG: nuclear transport factor 2 family protein [Deltaproteobacteria bacterium]|nr:nuclear transport factor 2 family protein [Deltaproteobacteria bacterium]